MGGGRNNRASDDMFNTLRPRQNGRHFPDDILNALFKNENAWILINISLKFVLKCPFNDIPALVQIMTWRRPGDKPLSGPIYIYAHSYTILDHRLLTHIWVTRPQLVNAWRAEQKATGEIFKCIFYEIELLCFESISLGVPPTGRIDNESAFFQGTGFHRTGAKPLPESILT